MDRREKRRLLNEKRRKRRERYGIWLDNKYKIKRHNKKWIKPVSKICRECKKRRVIYHHFYCHPCWLKVHGKIEQETTTIFLNPEALEKESEGTSEHEKQDIHERTTN